jgi:hypothetical protein
MPSSRISTLPSYSTPISTDILPIVDTTNGVTKQVTVASLNTQMGWRFLGQGTASSAVRTSTVTWTGTFAQLHIEYFIAGYSGGAIGRVIVGPSGGPSETAGNMCTSLIEGVTITTSSVSVPGWPTAVTAAAVPRYGHMWIDNQASVVKRMTGHGQHSGTAPTVVPTQMRMEGMWSDTTNLIQSVEMAVYAAVTGTTVAATTFAAGTFFNVWGRNNN